MSNCTRSAISAIPSRGIVLAVCSPANWLPPQDPAPTDQFAGSVLASLSGNPVPNDAVAWISDWTAAGGALNLITDPITAPWLPASSAAKHNHNPEMGIPRHQMQTMNKEPPRYGPSIARAALDEPRVIAAIRYIKEQLC